MWRGNTGLKVVFHIKYYKGSFVNPSFTYLDINTELVYANGCAAHFMPLYPLKEQDLPEQEKNISTVWLIVNVLLVLVSVVLLVVLSLYLFGF